MPRRGQHHNTSTTVQHYTLHLHERIFYWTLNYLWVVKKYINASVQYFSMGHIIECCRTMNLNLLPPPRTPPLWLLIPYSKLLLLLFTTFTTTLTNSMQKGEHCNFENQQSRRCVCFNCTTIAIDLLLPASAVWVCDWFDWRFVWCHRYQQGRQFVSRWDVERLKRLDLGLSREQVEDLVVDVDVVFYWNVKS